MVSPWHTRGEYARWGSKMLEQRQDSLDRTDIHDVLSNKRRVLVLEHLSRSGRMSLRQLANEIAADETEQQPAPRPARQSVYVTLHQSHLPKLDRLDIVDYDATSKHVALDHRADDLRVYLEVVGPGEISQGEYQVGLAVLGLSLTLASVLGVPLVSAVSPLGYAIATILVLITALLHQLGAQGSPILDQLRDKTELL